MIYVLSLVVLAGALIFDGSARFLCARRRRGPVSTANISEGFSENGQKGSVPNVAFT